VRARALPAWWPLPALMVAAAALRLSTLSLQSFWYDEAYTPVHVLHASLGATLSSWLAHENTPPLWYLLAWAMSRVFGTGVVALRLPSALFGIALVGVGWAIGAELGSRRTAITLAAILTVNPLFVWYSQEARAYELFALLAGLSLLCFLRARRLGTPGSLAWWSAVSILALLTHYFAVFLVGPEALLLLVRAWRHGRDGRRYRVSTFAAVGAVVACGVALVPLVIAQGGHGTQWIGRWALSQRLIQIPGYYLLGANGAVLGHGLLLISALPLLATVVLGYLLAASGRLTRSERTGVALTGGLGLCAIAIPLALALAGADYLAPRNTIADLVALSAAFAVVLAARSAGQAGVLITVWICVTGLAVLVATDLDPRLQRGAWSAVAASLRPAPADHAIVTVEDGAAPLEYYVPKLGLRYLTARRAVRVSEIDLVGYAPLRAGAASPPTPAFVAAGRANHHDLLVYRFVARTPQLVSGRFLRSLTMTLGARASSEALVPAALPSRAVR
jgi:uncharacterized membrane protein